MTVKITSKNFAGGLSKLTKAIAKNFVELDAYVKFAMKQAGSQNYTYVNLIMNDSNLKGADRRAIQHIIEDFCDCTLKGSAGKYGFANKKSKGFKYVGTDKSWMEYKPTAEPQVIEVEKAVKQLITRLQNAVDHKGKAELAKGEVTKAKDTIAGLRKLVAA